MEETTQTSPTEKTAWRTRLAAAWQRVRAMAVSGWPVVKTKVTTWWHAVDTDRVGIALALLMLLIALLLFTRTPGPKPPQPDATASLAQRVAALETRLNALSTEPAQPAPSQDRSPDPAPARPGAPRAALRPTQPAAAQAPGRIAWEPITDFDAAVSANR
jgi:hypothetical protein